MSRADIISIMIPLFICIIMGYYALKREISEVKMKMLQIEKRQILLKGLIYQLKNDNNKDKKHV